MKFQTENLAIFTCKSFGSSSIIAHCLTKILVVVAWIFCIHSANYFVIPFLATCMPYGGCRSCY